MNPRLDELLAARRRALEDDLADHDLAAATRRLAGRIAGEELARVLEQHTTAVPAPGAQASGDGLTARRNAEQLLEARCLTAVQQDTAAALVSAFPHDYDSAGATVFGCLLYLTGRHEAATFWWRYAAGDEDTEAAQLLTLYHWALADPVTADLWTQHTAAPPPRLPRRPVRRRPCRDATTLVDRTEPAIKVVADDPDCGEVCLPDDDLGRILAACHR